MQGIGGESVARGCLTAGQILMQAAASNSGLVSLHQLCTEEGYVVTN